MANEISLYFGSLALSMTNNITISEINVKEGKVLKTTSIPKSENSIAETAKKDTLQISVKGDISGSEYDDLRSKLDTLRGYLQDGKQKFTFDDDRYIMAQLKDFSFSYTIMRLLAEWTATFIADYPFWLAETALEVTKIIGTDVNSGVGFTVNNPGNAPARVKVEFTAPAGGISDDIQLENETLSQIMKYRGDIVAADVLEIDNRYDTDDFEVLNDGEDDIANFDGDFFTLGPGDNTIKFTGTNATVVKFTYKATYF